MVGGPIPTNDNMADAYEMVLRGSMPKSGVKVTRVSATQLSSLELREIEGVRKIAIEKIRDIVGDRGFEFTFAHEMDLWPREKTPSDKLVFRCYSDGQLVGYALVVRGWPDSSRWTIQHLILHPGHRGMGYGSALIAGVEKDALDTTQTVNEIMVVPLRPTSEFFDGVGYKGGGEVTIDVTGVGSVTLRTFEKKIR